MRGGAPKKFFFYENALSGSIHSTYQLPSLQTDQKPTLGQPSEELKSVRCLHLYFVFTKLTIFHISLST